MRQIVRKSYRDTRYLLNKEAGREQRVLTYDTHIGFPMGIIEDSIPAGHYFLALNSANHCLILMNAPISNSSTSINVDTDNDSALLQHTDLHEAAIRPEGLHDVHSWYFPMHEYHSELSLAHVAIMRFLDQQSYYRRAAIDYKRSILLYGETGTGKTSYLRFLSQYLIDHHQAIILHVTSRALLSVMQSHAVPMLNELAAGRWLVIIIEEVATLAKEGHVLLLNLLDHPLLRDNVIFLMTTNTPELVPENILDRPSRVDILTEVAAEGLQSGFIPAWYQHLTGKTFPEAWNNHSFLEANLSPAYLEELFILTEAEGLSVDAAWNRLEKRRKLIRSGFTNQ